MTPLMDEQQAARPYRGASPWFGKVTIACVIGPRICTPGTPPYARSLSEFDGPHTYC